MKRLLFILLLCLPLLHVAQPKKKVNPRVSLRGYMGIPPIVGSKQFKTAFNGVIETGLSANVRLFDNFYAGAGYQYSNFKVNKKEWSASIINPTSSLTSVFYKTQMQEHSGYVKIGYDKFFSEIGYVSYALNVGYATAFYKDVILDTNAANRPYIEPGFSSPYVQPEISFNFLAERSVSFSLLISYTSMLYRFDPRAPRFNHVGEVREARNRSNMNWFNIGIGFNILLGK